MARFSCPVCGFGSKTQKGVGARHFHAHGRLLKADEPAHRDRETNPTKRGRNHLVKAPA